MGDLEAVGMAGLAVAGMGAEAAAEATGNRICGRRQFLSKKTEMEVSKDDADKK
jgi:hypothetical protein